MSQITFCVHIHTYVYRVCCNHIFHIFLYSTAISTAPGYCSDGELRLEGSNDDVQANTREGRVEICINNAWGTICDTLFGSKEAEVVCRQLKGFQMDGKRLGSTAFNSLKCTALNAGAWALRQYGPGKGPIFLNQLDCSGLETSLLECGRFTPLGLTTCEHLQVAGVRCTGKRHRQKQLSSVGY